MGLDMYLYRKTYVKNWEWTRPEEKYTITATKGDGTVFPTDKLVYLVEEVAYWRKANAIHKWFVDNCQEGVDDCKEYYIDQSQLEELVTICKSVIADPSKSKTLLPTSSGFFFGGTEYDEWYIKDLQDTVDQLTPLINTEGEYYYRASW